MGVVGSCGWYAALPKLSTAPARTGARIHGLRRSAWHCGTGIRGEHRRLACHQEIAERAPIEAFAPSAHKFNKARGSSLGIRERVMGFAVHDAQLTAEPLETNRVLEVEQLGREPGGVDVVGIEAGTDCPPDQPRVERVSAVLHKDGAGGKALEPLDDK